MPKMGKFFSKMQNLANWFCGVRKKTDHPVLKDKRQQGEQSQKRKNQSLSGIFRSCWDQRPIRSQGKGPQRERERERERSWTENSAGHFRYFLNLSITINDFFLHF